MTHRPLLRIATLLALGLNIGSGSTPARLSAQQQSPRPLSTPPGQTVTRLADGRSLVFGGEGASVSASMWDPRAQAATPTAGQPIVPRAWHSATLLSDGTVLVAGGRNARGLVDTAEIFEPASGTFRQLSISGAARALHTATLLIDGRVLMVGGIGNGATALSTERWDLMSETAVTIGSDAIDRSGHTATLAPDGTVLLSGGQTADGRPASDLLVIDPATASAIRRPAEPGQEPAVALAASIPSANADDIPVETHIALRFSGRLASDSITTDAVTLNGPDGLVTTAVVAAEDGRLVFLWPGAPLAEGATYDVAVTGLADASGREIAAASVRFTTKQRATNSDDAVDRETWTPDAQGGEKGWRTNRPPSPWESLVPLTAAPGVTAVSGRVLRLDGRPLPDVTLEIDGREARTDRTGRFLIQLDSGASRRATLEIDARTANKPQRTYGFYEALIAVRGSQTNVLPFTIWSPLIDTAHQVTIPSPTTSETVVATPLIPGLELHLPAGTVITDEEHQTARTVSITAIPLDRTPFPMPDNATFSMFFTIQPGGAYLSTPGPVKGGWIVYPNVRHSRVGSRVQFFNYDPDDKGWYPYGMGTITGTSVVPEPKTRIYGFTGASFNDGTPTPPAGPPPGDCCGNGGDPVNLTTGIFTYEMTDMVVPDVMPLVLTRTYNSRDPYGRAFGIGMSHSYGLFEHSENWHTEMDLYLPDGAKIHFNRTSDPTLGVEQTVFEHTTTPTEFYKARMTAWGDPILSDHGWQVTRKDGTVYVFPHAGSPLQAIRDRHGNEIRLTWGQFGRLERVTSPNGRWLAFSYGAGGRVSQVIDNIGRTVGYTYDTSGRLLTVTDPENHVTSYTWNTNDQMLTVKPPNLQGTQTSLVTNEYTTSADAPTPVGWVKKQTYADGGVSQFVYTVLNGKSTQTDVTDPLGNVQRVTFNPDGYTLSDTRALNTTEEQTTWSNRPGSNNFVAISTDSLAAQVAYVFDAFGNATSVTRCLPGPSPCTQTSPGAVTTRYTYEPRYNLIATSKDRLNHTTTYEYDDAGNLASITDPLQHQTVFTHNNQGQTTSVRDALLHTTTFGYVGGDLTTITDSLTRVTTRFVDAAGRVLSVRDPLGATTRYTYDADNRLRSLSDAMNGQTLFDYWPEGQLKSVTDANSHTTNYTADLMGRMASRTDPLQRRETFTYDANGNSYQWTDRKGQTTTRAYDALNRLHQISYADNSTVTFTYDSRNRVREIADTLSGQISRDYDDFDRLITETTTQGVVSYTYDDADRRATMTVPGQPDVSYAYDDADRLTGITRGAVSVSMQYDPANRRTVVTLPNGIVTEYTYDDANQVTGLTYRTNALTIGALTYGYDVVGRRTEQGGSWARTGLPQAVPSATYDVANQLTAWDTQMRQYDGNGNLASDGLTSYIWDSRQRLASATGPAPASFSYDSGGRRVAATIQSAATAYAYDGGNVALEMRGGAATSLLAANGFDQWLARTDSGGTETLLADALGSVVAIVNSASAVATQYTYEPFGASLAQGSAGNAIRFTGREQDTASLYYYRARYYDSSTGRFLSEDPLRVHTAESSSNFYAYVEDKPTNATDPTGLKIRICSRPAFRNSITGSFGNHSFFADTRNGDNCGRGAGNHPHGTENLQASDTFCTDVPGSQGREDEVMKCCQDKAGSFLEGSPYTFPLGDCNALTSRCLRKSGLPDVQAPGGRFGCTYCPSRERGYPPMAPYMRWR